MTPSELAQIADPQARAVEAHSCAQEGEAVLRQCRAVRDAAIADLRVAGWTQRQIADLLGLSPAAIALIDKGQGIVTQRAAHRKDTSSARLAAVRKSRHPARARRPA